MKAGNAVCSFLCLGLSRAEPPNLAAYHQELSEGGEFYRLPVPVFSCLCVSEKLGVLFVHFSVSVYCELILIILLLVTGAV